MPIILGYLESVYKYNRHIVLPFLKHKPHKTDASFGPSMFMALKPKDIRVRLPVQLILDCHWIVCIRGEGLTDMSNCTINTLAARLD